MDPRALAGDLVGEPMQLANLLEQGLELRVVDGHVPTNRTALDERSARRRDYLATTIESVFFALTPSASAATNVTRKRPGRVGIP
jgi:hypothetical protein